MAPFDEHAEIKDQTYVFKTNIIDNKKQKPIQTNPSRAPLFKAAGYPKYFLYQKTE